MHSFFHDFCCVSPHFLSGKAAQGDGTDLCRAKFFRTLNKAIGFYTRSAAICKMSPIRPSGFYFFIRTHFPTKSCQHHPDIASSTFIHNEMLPHSTFPFMHSNQCVLVLWACFICIENKIIHISVWRISWGTKVSDTWSFRHLNGCSCSQMSKYFALGEEVCLFKHVAYARPFTPRFPLYNCCSYAWCVVYSTQTICSLASASLAVWLWIWKIFTKSVNRVGV